ncbi:hypothetical protein BTO20_16610 [Mycobacterium dioxanotrophicus]|jgi:hypothetical protein|uniref:Phasin domain-containing protein n=1 Tax=Mycobacterium dioxanotrophicus TaxID=482462 RepID=A0A1Y0C470_9MYCO|nr:hypothetical protein [Mycobacterium dioxanotrophicus]ART69980.1 hypothetical protein BTO20_16610 [Mycobacterium dioxanotrophicus]
MDFGAFKSPQFDNASIDETISRIREMNERLIETSKTAGRASLDAYEATLKSMVDFSKKSAGGTQLDWLSALATAHAQFIQDLSAAYIKATREALK